MLKTIAAAACAAVVLLAIPQPAAQAQFKTRNYTVNVDGRTPIMRGWSCWHSDCSYAECRIRDDRKPRQGKITVQVRRGKIPSGSGRCSGRPTTTLWIYYTPNRNARGRDYYQARVTADNGGKYILKFNLRNR